ncbi:AQG_2a_G0056330.mRNA.1.CDS.1 [Saccharomyces cerevisiae]|uniref:Histidine--tRNA ligase, mitochondrial n=8 Tax=Saccharomyces TaxID=4930 RepID=SYH_YEAST|nr:histidine--tRNA ligase [Saccharomyces cerevisiae S288C]P07263.2 RecName: Full=Histidine--tRNA ligase, mitochondrial; AltName: Full=Histidyl-tRNA synthetase; Short=HisRS; Flags: Precursor [Saccharomyces cerevisiae S288C]AAT92770.1 YPR033C [Saccharomyces cerevisiae]AHY78202.1 Hts1p [Saccharomyces cerevisiae YJM993]AJV91698.1 Hts1p [Saccharomyces cerevisiae YJM1463]AJV92138.1 Hts1p [Saccharomyces cerevisiae YJM1477]AJV93276.1 Hts1p [Saccharomyces cerevisiae YJM1526]AJV93715.1 Hts1p [Saccharo|eukprot:NP_015358.1 histidine--tRNA ligase [Saccharomyces cerevisiae S288C]
MLSRSLNKVVTSIKSSSIIRMSSATAAATSAPTANAANALKASKAPKKGKLQVSLKTPKGTKDWADSDMVIREAIFSTLSGLFKKHGGVTIDTPVFELREILAGKYGEDSKLIYNLEDQGGELCSLRYDLTVPFARYVAMNNIQSIKRYHIAKVYRRDQPAMTKGRMREFYQCDFDVAGTFESMVPDSECLSILVEGLTSLGIKDFKIKLNHRKILDGIFQIAGVKDEDVRKISSAVDKLDKSPWEAVKKEMTEEKGQSEETADKIGEYVKLNGSLKEIHAVLSADANITSNEKAKQGLDDIATLMKYTEAFDIDSFISFDLSLARGLDYYTGLIYEVVTSASAPPENASELKKKAKSAEDASEFVGVGSIAAGGRYDNLVNMFSEASGKKSTQIPCVGISFGVERIFSLIKQRINSSTTIKPTATQVFVMAFGGGKDWTGYLPERMKVTKQLWDAGIEAEYVYKAKANPRKQFDAAEKAGCHIAVILGKEEYLEGKLRVKRLGQEFADDDGELVSAADIVPIVQEKLSQIHEDGLNEVTRLIKGL